jgi:hypothetical protein
MAERIVFPEFRDQLEHTRYPFSDSASLVSPTTGQAIDKDTFLDASLYPIGATARLRLSSVVVTPRLITIYIGDQINPDLASVEFDPLTPPDLLRFTDTYDRPAGVIVSDSLRLARFSGWESGTHTFGVVDTEFAASCVIPVPGEGVLGLANENNEFCAGDVWIAGDNGVVVRDDGDGHIRIDVVGDPLFVRRLCVPLGAFNPPSIIKTINGCTPDEYGYFNLTVGDHQKADTIMRINPTEDATALVVEAVGQLVRSTN